MGKFDANAVGSEAAKKMVSILSGAGKDVVSYAQAEAKKLAMSAQEIAIMRASGDITEEELKLHLDIQKNASKAVLLAVAGVSILAAEAAINAALEIVGGALKTATGMALPG
jgi:hypothetical protein